MTPQQIHRKMTKKNWSVSKWSPKIMMGKLWNSGTKADFEMFVSHDVTKRDTATANAHAAYEAVEGTWLKNLNPNAMEDVVKALEAMTSNFHVITDSRNEEEQENAIIMAIDALQAAKLTNTKTANNGTKTK